MDVTVDGGVKKITTTNPKAKLENRLAGFSKIKKKKGKGKGKKKGGRGKRASHVAHSTLPTSKQ